MEEKNIQWNQIFNEARQNINILNNPTFLKGLNLRELLNEGVSFAIKYLICPMVQQYATI